MSATRILHRAANERTMHHLAAHPAVDVLEGDLWMRGGRLVAHHDRPLGALPLLLHKRGFSRVPGDLVTFRDLATLMQSGATLMVDLRSWFRDPTVDAARELVPLDDRSRIGVSCEAWPVADRLRAWMPDLHVVYSVRSRQQLDRYLVGRHNGSLPETAISVRHTLLTSARQMQELQQVAGRVSAWTVDDIDRAIELVEWGVDALISNQLHVLNSL
ncbi:MAG: hypothetical protein QF664_00215 [Dehalococcoidia bacterium]|jgi:glycerophosphoryl diester phosphodiesterase|nr:hypothetical protein [Dehalococcoidia bacterium]